MSHKPFIETLSFNPSENELQEVFAPNETADETNFLTDRAPGMSRGFVFVARTRRRIRKQSFRR